MYTPFGGTVLLLNKTVSPIAISLDASVFLLNVFAPIATFE